MKDKSLKLTDVLAISQPRSWINSTIPFATGYLLVTGRFSVAFWLGLIYFSFCYNLLIHGVDLIYSDPNKSFNKTQNQQKKLILSHNNQLKLWGWIGLTNLPFVLYFVLTGSLATKIVSAALVMLAIGNSLKSIRLKDIPPVDAIIASLLAIGPLIFGLVSAGYTSRYLPATLAYLLWSIASYSFSQIQNIQTDRNMKQKSIATYLGAKRTASLSYYLYLCAALIIAITYGMAGVIIAILMLLYALNVSFFRKYKSDAQCTNFDRGRKNLSWLNLIAGFWIIQILFFVNDPFGLGSTKLVIVIHILIVISVLESLIIAHNLIGFSRPKAKRLAEWPKVSILIHAYNQADNIASTVLALIGQNYPEFEIIFTDLGSDDNTLKIVEGYEDPRIKIVKIDQLKKGWTLNAHAANELLKHANGQLIVLLSADTVLKPNALSTFASIMEAKKLDLMSLLPADQNKTVAQKLVLSQNQFLLLGVYPAAYLAKNIPKFASAYSGLMVFDHQKIKSNHGFDPVKNSPLEDMDLATQAKLNGLKTGFYIGSDIAVSQNHASLGLILKQNNRRFYPILHFNMPLAISLITGGIFLFCLPLLLLIYHILVHNLEFVIGLVLVLAIGLANRVVIALISRQNLISCVLYPLTSLIALAEIFSSMLNYELLKPRWLKRTEAH